MAILYRAIWTDTDNDLVGRVRNTFSDWVLEKSDGTLDATTTGTTTSEDGKIRVRVECADSAFLKNPIKSAFRASFIETHSNGNRWTTTVRSWEQANAESTASDLDRWIWVDIDAVTDDSSEDLSADAPRFVRNLLSDGPSPHRFEMPLSATPKRYVGADDGEALADLLTHINRDVPIVAFSPIPDNYYVHHLPPNTTLSQWLEKIIMRTASMTAGLALICQLDNAASQSLKLAIGDGYSVRDGAFRIYLPGLDPALDETWKHRYTVPARFIGRPEIAGRIINRAIALRASAKRAPVSYEAAARLLDSVKSREPDELRELLAISEEETTDYQNKLATLDQKYTDSIEELQQLAEENNRLRSDLSRAYRQLSQYNKIHESSTRVTEADESPDIVDSPTEAATAAQLYFVQHLNFPENACVELELLDNSAESRAWGATSWRAFRALNAYAEDLAGSEGPGTFWTWCRNSRSPFTWPATAKKLAMVESQTVNQNDKLKKKRIFPVDSSIDPSGTIYMQAHIKIAEGGGPLAPRIYFYVARNFHKVCIGYFGPHKNVPNTIS
jgi:hypothetical protein